MFLITISIIYKSLLHFYIMFFISYKNKKGTKREGWSAVRKSSASRIFSLSSDDTIEIIANAFAIMLKWVHYCPLPRDRAIAPSDTKMIVPSETTRHEKDERRTFDRRKDGIDTVRSARNAKTATPDAIMRRCFRFGVRNQGSRTWQSVAQSAIARSSRLPAMCNSRDKRDRVLYLLSLYFDTS